MTICMEKIPATVAMKLNLFNLTAAIKGIASIEYLTNIEPKYTAVARFLSLFHEKGKKTPINIKLIILKHVPNKKPFEI